MNTTNEQIAQACDRAGEECTMPREVAGEADGWMPISTAPDKGEFLVYMPDERTKIHVAKWHPNVKTIGGHFAFDLTSPTHWMPLPAAPIALAQTSKEEQQQ